MKFSASIIGFAISIILLLGLILGINLLFVIGNLKSTEVQIQKFSKELGIQEDSVKKIEYNISEDPFSYIAELNNNKGYVLFSHPLYDHKLFIATYIDSNFQPIKSKIIGGVVLNSDHISIDIVNYSDIKKENLPELVLIKNFIFEKVKSLKEVFKK